MEERNNARQEAKLNNYSIKSLFCDSENLTQNKIYEDLSDPSVDLVRSKIYFSRKEKNKNAPNLSG